MILRPAPRAFPLKSRADVSKCVGMLGRVRRRFAEDLDFEDYGEDERALGGLLVDVALEVDADFFLDDAPVGFFFGVGLLDGFDDDFAGASHQFVAVVAEHAAGDDFWQGFHFAGVLIDGDDGDDDAVFGKMLAIADDYFLDFLEGAGIDADAARSDGIAAADAILRELDRLAVFEEEDFAGDAAELMSERGVAEKMAVFAVNGNEIFRLDELQNQFLFFLAGVAGNMDRAGGIVVVDEGTTAEHVVQHAENGFFVAGNDARGKNDAVVFVDGNEAMIIDGDARKGRHRFGLAAAGKNDDALGIEIADVLRANDHAVGDAQIIHGVRDFDVVDHAAADEGNFAADASGDVDHLLDAVNGRGEAGKDDPARRGAAKLFDAGDDGAFGGSEAGALDVCGIAEKREDAFAAVAGESVEIEGRAVYGSLIDLEVAGVNDDADGRAHGQGDAVDGAVGDGDELDLERADFDEAAGEDFAESGGVEEAGFFEAFLDEGEREAGAVNGDV